MNKVIKWILLNRYLLTILLLGGILRFVNLGYSDFQGDEIKALFLPEPDQSAFNFLLDQRKGPIQFVITYLLKFADPLYWNQFLIRMPFAIAGLVAVYYFFKLVKNIFNEKVAFFASFFFATNGFLLAFSRIVQYQSFVIMFMIGSLYYLRNRKVYLGLIFWALSILSHYDGIFIFPLVFYYLYLYLTDTKDLKHKEIIKIKKIEIGKSRLFHFVMAGIIAVLLLLSFYIPFAMNISTATQNYWLGRLTGEVSTKLSSSKYLFTVYQPIYVIHIYLALFVLGISTLILKITSLFKPFKFLSKVIKKLPELPNVLETLIVLFWVVVPLIFMEVFVYIPGTHIYTYIIPAVIFCGLGVFYIEQGLKKLKYVSLIGITIVFAFIYLQMYALFVDNKQEYPWENEKFFIWTFSKPTPMYHLSMFGFPYYRDWENIQRFVESYKYKQVAYSTNERESISRHYINLKKGSNEAGFYVHIRNPQSFEDRILQEKVVYWASKYSPIYTFSKNGVELVDIYIMQTGTKEEVIQKGY